MGRIPHFTCGFDRKRGPFRRERNEALAPKPEQSAPALHDALTDRIADGGSPVGDIQLFDDAGNVV